MMRSRRLSAICVPFLRHVNLRPAHGAQQHLSERLALHARVLDSIRDHLPFSLEPHCHSCVVDSDGRRIVLYVLQAVYATQLRFHVPGLIRALQHDAGLPLLKSLKQMPIRVYVPEGLLQAKPRTLPPAWRQGDADLVSVLARLEAKMRSR